MAWARRDRSPARPGSSFPPYGRAPLRPTAVRAWPPGRRPAIPCWGSRRTAAFRALQGLGGGGMLALVVAVIGDLVSPRERGRYQGHAMSAMTLGSVLGPVLGGLLAGQGTILGIAGWRWIFWINVPVGLVALMVWQRVLRLTATRRDRHIDWWGAALLALGPTPLLLIAEQGDAWGWASGRAVGCYAVAALGLAGLLTVSVRRGADALIPLRLFRTNNFTVSIIGTFVLGLAQFGGLGVLPLYPQLVKGASPAKAGLLILPIALGQTAASFAAGRSPPAPAGTRAWRSWVRRCWGAGCSPWPRSLPTPPCGSPAAICSPSARAPAWPATR
ncbi:MFS transporter [Streptomyces sp. FXJ1.4098]|nr:MFS transporter [Streptomyces sp. FXJ1.4098]